VNCLLGFGNCPLELPWCVNGVNVVRPLQLAVNIFLCLVHVHNYKRLIITNILCLVAETLAPN
jgi:hypothetical protein